MRALIGPERELKAGWFEKVRWLRQLHAPIQGGYRVIAFLSVLGTVASAAAQIWKAFAGDSPTPPTPGK